MKTLSRSASRSELNNRNRRDRAAVVSRLRISVFSTQLGWMGLLGEGDKLVSVFAGHSSSKSVLSAAARTGDSFRKVDWDSTLRGMLEAYAEGDVVDFFSVKLLLPEMTEFRRKVVMATRGIGYGETATYGEIARRVGHPGAARAVGTVMSTNRFPIVIPCHRVLASGGKLGGYTSPSGTGLKQKLLDMEAK